jgi:N-acetylmuramoyl-L-alanine amidase
MPQTRIGEYRVRSGNADVRFWRLVPGTHALTLLLNTNLGQIAPNDPTTFNTVTLPPRFGIFDIVVRMSEPVVEQQLTDAQSVDLLVTSLTAQPAATAMPIWEDGTGSPDHRVANFSFAVRIPQGQQQFEGTLVLTAQNGTTANAGVKTVRLPLRVLEFQREADLFVAFVATPQSRRPDAAYCWSRISVTAWAAASAGAPVAGATVEAKILRDNFRNGFDGRNRRVSLTTNAAGVAAFPHDGGERTTLAFPTRWPLICTASAAGSVPRAHLARLEAADIDHNQNPHAFSPIRLIAVATARTEMAAKTVLLDPGHGVVYGFASQRRSQEWFVGHRIATRVRELLRDRFGLPPGGVFMTRTAGFGLIDPRDMGRNDAPERGAQRFLFDLAGRRVRIRQATLGLHHLSDLVLTGDDHDPGNITPAERDRFLSQNAATVTTIVTRMQSALPPGQRVQPGSVRWNAATDRYVCRIERHPHAAGVPPVVDDARNVRITTADWFSLDADMLNRLADRTALWSLDRELGSGPAAHAPSGRPSFDSAIRAAMQSQNARSYIRDAIVAELALEAPYLAGATIPTAYRNKETMGWHFQVRRDYINRKNCDVALTIHENAATPVDAVGMAMLVGTAPPAGQVTAAKIFMKYVDPFDQGLRQGGIVDNVAGQLGTGNTRRDKHVYFELEFMTSTIRDNPEVRAAVPARYQYEEMAQPDVVDRVAEQITAGIVEFLIDPQSDIGTVTYDASNLPTW